VGVPPADAARRHELAAKEASFLPHSFVWPSGSVGDDPFDVRSAALESPALFIHRFTRAEADDAHLLVRGGEILRALTREGDTTARLAGIHWWTDGGGGEAVAAGNRQQ